MFTTRLISGIVLVAAALVVVISGGPLLFAVNCAIAFVGLFEFYRVLGIEKNGAGIAGYLSAAAYFGILWFEGRQYVEFVMILTVMRGMKSLLAANLLGIVVAFFVSRPCVLQWEMQGATVAAIIAQLAQLTMLLICVMRQSHAHFRDGFTPKPEDPFDGLPS